MLVSRMKEILGNMDDTDEIICVWFDFTEVVEHSLSDDRPEIDYDTWKKVVKAWERKIDGDQSISEFIDRKIAEFTEEDEDHDEDCECSDCY